MIPRLKLATLLLSVGALHSVRAQINPPEGQYFFNQFISNASLAGTEKGVSLNALVRRQFSGTPGAPTTQIFTGEYQLNSRVGLGLILGMDQSGLIKQNVVSAAFVYRVPFSDRSQLKFGLGVGFTDQHIDQTDVIGQADPAVDELNAGKIFMTFNSGLTYTRDELTVQVSIPNTRAVDDGERENGVDRSTFLSAVSYKFRIDKSVRNWFIEPKFAYRGIKGINNIVDIGVQVGLVKDQVRIISIYHSSKTMSIGLGFQSSSKFGIQVLYSSGTDRVLAKLGNTLEINLATRLLRGR